MNMTVQVRQRGAVTLPVELRKKHNIKQGDTFHLVDLDGLFVLSPLAPIVPELAREIERTRLEIGLTTTELLQALREQRAQYHQENYDDRETE
jgi:bifunctional DNA-binding transcriptional regulator/antitoxin component of YhaV-PrlF toxin-antitoxin module